MEFFLNVFTEFSDKKYFSLRELEPATPSVSNQDSTTAPARHMWETETLNLAQFLLKWFIRFPEFTEITEFNESSTPFRKNSIRRLSVIQIYHTLDGFIQLFPKTGAIRVAIN